MLYSVRTAWGTAWLTDILVSLWVITTCTVGTPVLVLGRTHTLVPTDIMVLMSCTQTTATFTLTEVNRLLGGDARLHVCVCCGGGYTCVFVL